MTEATRILAIRHGQTAWNADGRIQGHRDIGLDAIGQLQADRLAAALADEQLHAIYSSDLSRAFGEFEGLSFAQIEQRWPAQALRWRRRDPDFSPTGGESLERFRGRVLAAVHRLAHAHRGHAIALVTHGGVLDLPYRAATRLPLDAPRTWSVENTSINRLLHSDQGMALIGWADVGHLDHARDDLV